MTTQMSNTVSFKIPRDKTERNYIGFNPYDNSEFAFPPGYLDVSGLSEHEKDRLYKREAKNIIMLLKRVRQEYYQNGKSGELFQFYSMVWLIQDYIDHGYYIETEVISSTAAGGKINWKKTIKQNSILFDNNNIIYTSFVRNRNISNDSRTITQIYKACLSYSAQRLGFIYGIEKTEPSVFDIESKDKGFLVYYLKNALNSTFKDYKKTLIKHLLAIIVNADDKSPNTNVGFSIYNTEFEHVFEFVVNNVFGTENVKDFYNTYSYYLPNRVAASKPRPDTVMRDEENRVMYIIDSKYYNYGFSGRPKELPQSADISKQIAYNHYLRDNMGELKDEGYIVRSVFMLPYASEQQDEYIKFVGYAERDGNADADDKVAVCLVDIKALIDAYLSGSKELTPNSLAQVLSLQFKP